ncbi:dihydrodipicolinate synthase family protein [Luteimonas sp. S4-F44]|uniref:dihydrodipicolinate synthase family protein n=1 Tax=Luteimonas sp. S4-F44 TaxID=2925842 RepID=UPI001F53C90B|nr:dihydrodipicolinate synthase family protein [Luteimonas sp. S4-F44]UNK42421.1 dihydrodipicolinate synthase family protein [Luteimonas sp. S4-F44]
MSFPDGLCAFPLTPFDGQRLDRPAFARLMARLVAARVDAICALGSTGSYAYLHLDERKAVARKAVALAGDIPLMVGIGALATRDVLALAEDAQRAGARALLLAPVSYQPLTDDEVFALYATVCRNASVPVCVYDNPGTTHFVFGDALYARIAALPGIAAIKIPGIASDQAIATARIAQLRGLLPSGVALGISGDPMAADGLIAGCDLWYSVIGGLYPEVAMAIVAAARAGDAALARRLSARLAPLWDAFARHGGSIRVIASAAELAGVCAPSCLPAPLRSLDGADRAALAQLLEALALA